MKKVFKLFLPVLLLSIGFVSCEKDEDEDNGSSEIVGTWKVVEVSGYEAEDGEISDSWDPKTDQEILDVNGFLYLRFDKNGDAYLATENINQMELVGEWEIRKGKLYLSGFEGDEIEVIMTELTSTKMVWEEAIEPDESGLCEYYNKTVFSKVQ